MTDNKDDKTIGVKKTLTLKPSGMSQGTVRQDMGRGRTKSVVVETVKRRTTRPLDEKPITPIAAAPAARCSGSPCTAGSAPSSDAAGAFCYARSSANFAAAAASAAAPRNNSQVSASRTVLAAPSCMTCRPVKWKRAAAHCLKLRLAKSRNPSSARSTKSAAGAG